jgi:SNW domain-containing protein 1
MEYMNSNLLYKKKDFGDGGSYPEIHIAQYPLDCGRKTSSAGAPGSGTLALQTDTEGK